LVQRKRIKITGRVQGVGCRPFIYKTARTLNLSGEVYNDSCGVTIEVQGAGGKIAEFINSLQSQECQPLLRIASINVEDIAVVEGEDEFVINVSSGEGSASAQVTPDSATCSNCLAEMNDKTDFRYRYPFINCTNCTNCGPRYSIVRSIPYDRPNTTMGKFEMCDACRGQYTEVSDRRFHAQPVACPKCGPSILLADNAGQTIESDSDTAISKTAELLREGKIVGIKGIGGFHLAVDALNEAAVERLRLRKRRDHKPFAMMAGSIDTISKYAAVDDESVKLLSSPVSPIVLLKKRPDCLIAGSVGDGVSTLGFMLCYSPLHHLLFAEDGIEVLVMTSANISDEPLICKNDIAVDRLGDVADAFLMHDREIYRQVDDSIVHIVDGRPAVLRRARGYVPSPILRKETSPVEVLAVGADLKNTFCFAKGNQFILSEHIGDLADALVYEHYKESIRHLGGLFEVAPEIIVCDLHPGYLSTQYAHSLKAKRVVAVQHHWAHIASVLAEYQYSEKVIGIVADGTGFGTDECIWGFEFLLADLKGFERFGHLDYFPLAGGDRSSKEAIRPVMGLLKCCGDDYVNDYNWLLGRIEPDEQKIGIIGQQLEKNINTVSTSSLGRLFDAVSAMVGLGNYNHFEAQLPMMLESVALDGIEEYYEFDFVTDKNGKILIDFRKIILQIIDDVKNNRNAGVISAKFHNSIAQSMVEMGMSAREKTGLNTVALSGGVFCNNYLANRLIKMLKIAGFCVLFKREVPANDGGISFGQAAIACEMAS